MKIKKDYWFLLATSFLGVIFWYQFSYNQLAFIKLNVSRPEALSIATRFLTARGEDLSDYKSATVFKIDRDADRYLQKTLGFSKMVQFTAQNDFEMFFWVVRLLKEHQKEQYEVTIDSSSGRVIDVQHAIENTVKMPSLEREEAKLVAEKFLFENFQVDLSGYEMKGDLKRIYDNRADYSFTWQRTDIAIPWSSDLADGTAKLLHNVIISGENVRSFSYNNLEIPEKFDREISRQNVLGQNLSSIFRVFYTFLLCAAIYFVVAKKNHLVMHTTKNFYLSLVIMTFLLTIVSGFNMFESLLYKYTTTSDLHSYLMRYAIDTLVAGFFLSITIIMPSLSGELLHYEVAKDHPQGSLLMNITSTFFSRSVAVSIILGYLVCLTMLGIQSVLVKLGQDHWGVWLEHTWFTQLTTAYWPFLAAVTIGFQASVSEEIIYRLFAINWGKKIFKNTIVAVLFSSVIWGFAHSGYPVYPMWFRGLEMTLMGIFLSIIYLRFGLITVIIGHYLFDVYWHCAAYLLSNVGSFDYYSSLAVFFLPMAWAGCAYLMNRSPAVQPLTWRLNKHQQFNLNVLKDYLRSHSEIAQGKTKEQIKHEIIAHGWDAAVVDTALDDLRK